MKISGLHFRAQVPRHYAKHNSKKNNLESSATFNTFVSPGSHGTVPGNIQSNSRVSG